MSLSRIGGQGCNLDFPLDNFLFKRLFHDFGGQTASEVIFDLRIELLDLENHKIDTHIATNKRP